MTLNTPCEIIVWEILPAIRRELAKSLIKDHGLSQKEAAEKLGLTEAAISRYMSGKRGDLKIPNGKIGKKIKGSANKILEGNNNTVITETCNICKILKSNNILENINHKC